MVTGAQSSEKGIPIKELAMKLQAPAEMVATEVDNLVSNSYAAIIIAGGAPRVYLTGTGIITASSTYS